jgi:hypothetical protein
MPSKEKRFLKAKSMHENDPFDKLEGPVIKSMVDMMKWHHRIPPDQLPTFLHEYCILHLVGTEKTHNATDTVYQLYHSIFNSHSDRKSLLACSEKCETRTIWERETHCYQRNSACTIREHVCFGSFLATGIEYQATEMATFLLSIMHQLVKCRVGCDGVNVYLKGNPTNNKATWKYYMGRNFLKWTKILKHSSSFENLLCR